MLVHDIVRRNAQFFPDADAVVVPGGTSYTWRELDTRTNALANAFAGLGLTKGDRLAMFAPNCAEYVEFFFACAKSGLIGAALNVRLAPAELTSYVEYVGPAAVLVHSDLVDAAAPWLDGAAAARRVVGFGGDHPYDLDLHRITEEADIAAPRVEILDTDIYQFAATSGTTGVPKAAMMTHRNATAAMLNWLAEIRVPNRATALQCIPFFFNPGGPAGLHPVLMKGGRTVIPPAFTPEVFLDTVEQYQVTHTILVPTMLQMVLDAQSTAGRDLSSLIGIITGGSPLSADLLGRGRELIGDVFWPIYGMAEMYACATILRPEDQFTVGTPQQRRQLSSIGKPMVLTQARVVDEHGHDVPTDGESPGEIWLSGDPVSPGYFRMPEETERSWEGSWFKSGDVAVVDGEHFLTIVDRLKDMIITGGINVFSVEVERAIMRHPAVAHAAVIGLPHETWGEAVHAVVVRQAGESVDEQTLIDFVATQLATYKKPQSVEFVDELPISGTGKVLKRVLREATQQ